MDFLVFSRADNLRVELFQQALARLDMPAAKVCSYHDVLDGKLPPMGENVMVRLESPGRDFELESRLIRMGGGPDVSPEVLSGGEKLINFGANDYLGLAADPRLGRAVTRAIETDGWGSGASPLITGRTAAHAELENSLADFIEAVTSNTVFLESKE